MRRDILVVLVIGILAGKAALKACPERSRGGGAKPVPCRSGSGLRRDESGLIDDVRILRLPLRPGSGLRLIQDRAYDRAVTP
jgi:hypothetical protein